MKKGRIVSLLAMMMVFGLCMNGQVQAACEIEWMYVQHRAYEDGRDFNRLAFGVLDGSGVYLTTDAEINTVTLYEAKIRLDQIISNR